MPSKITGGHGDLTVHPIQSLRAKARVFTASSMVFLPALEPLAQAGPQVLEQALAECSASELSNAELLECTSGDGPTMADRTSGHRLEEPGNCGSPSVCHTPTECIRVGRRGRLGRRSCFH